MALSKETRQAAKLYLLDQLEADASGAVRHTAETFDISETSVYHYLKQMEQDGIVTKKDHIYMLKEETFSFSYDATNLEEMDEDIIVQRDIFPIYEKLPENVRHIWNYCLMEMLNNAIDHSGADRIRIGVSQTYRNTTVSIMDNGVGIFTNIKEYFHFPNLDTAIMELFKGKLTTNRERHSGEGIFFSSRMVDVFAAFSDGKVFSRNQESAVQSVSSENEFGKGTMIVMKLSNFSNRKTTDIFSMFENDEGDFDKTSIPIRNIYDVFPVSRSQAKRLVKRFDQFAEVTLDFDGVQQLGQGFAHELFVVFAKQHPDVRIRVENTNDAVRRMIRHVDPARG